TTKNAVLGFCYRIGLRHDNAHTFRLPDGMDGFHAAVRTRRPQQLRGPNTYRKATAVNDATDPETRALVDEINASGFYAYDIAETAGISRGTITRWRAGE